ncbi:hypothetical protein BCR35DRAFT_307006 [Leucosporidium creatinivorum]|uniref:Probable 26S proteasome regulatory subunit p27 n=1 Tax=Leucosporidium creatinivorum TaxID=106004 RepID=A0A1Y2EQR8_9BASI|nr:hypothetical protein BCR35DRAFT_307006 [Leucosporidium creatinivorum]
MSITNLHDPSTAPRPPPASSNQPQPTLQSEVQRLTQLKDDLNASLEVYFGVLTTNKVNMQTPLIDPQGFPRSDIDVAGVRTARMQIIRLRNDLQGVQNEMEKLVERGLPRGEEGALVEEEGDAVMSNGTVSGVQQEETPFARIDGVFPGSPADTAGIKREDLLLSVAHLNSTNHDSLRAVGQLVGASEGVVLPLGILRSAGEGQEKQRLTLRLTPRTGWGGRGLLGCHIVPI